MMQDLACCCRVPKFHVPIRVQNSRLAMLKTQCAYMSRATFLKYVRYFFYMLERLPKHRHATVV
jgi:hypothetical protein